MSDPASESKEEHEAEAKYHPQFLEPGHVPPRTTHGTIEAQSREAGGVLNQHQAHDKAAGFPAVLRSLQNVFIENRAGPVRGLHALMVLNQKHGIDCMSCAWPEPDGKRRVAEFCESGAKAIGHELDTSKCGPEFFAKHSVAELSQMSDYWLERQGRLTHPMVLRDGATHYDPIEWEDAFKLIAAELHQLASPDEACFYTSGRASNEAAFVYQLFARQFGTNNLPDCSNMCHESSGTALTEVLGTGKGTVTLDDFNKTQLIVILGQNPGSNHPRMLTALAESKKHGAKIIAINPLPEAGLMGFMDPQKVFGMFGVSEPLADHFVQVKINGDIALLKGVMKRIVQLDETATSGAINWPFVNEHTHGINPLLQHIKATDWNDIVADSGIDQKQIELIGDILAGHDRIIFCWCMGVTQHREAVAAVKEIVNVLLLRGSIGKDGAGACPVRGHSNVQGDRTMGVWEKLQKPLAEKLKANFDFEPPRKWGHDAIESIKAMHDGKIKVFVSLGGNLLTNAPDTRYTEEAMGRLDLSVRIGTKLNRGDLVVGKQALILPCLGRTEIDRRRTGPQFVTTENSMGVVELSRGRFEPASEQLLSEVAILCGIAAETLEPDQTKIDWRGWGEDYDVIREAIAKTIPGCEEYNLRVREDHGFYLPNKARDGVFETDVKKAKFTVNEIPKRNIQPGQLVLMTIRSHDQFNSTIYGLHDRYRGIHNERHVLFMNEKDMDARGLKSRQIVDITSHFEGQTRNAKHFIVVPYNIPAGNCAMYYPEGNVLVPVNSLAKKSNQPSSKYVIVTVAVSSEQTRPFNYDRVDGGLITPAHA